MGFAKKCKNISVVIFLLSTVMVFPIANSFGSSDETFLFVLIVNLVTSALLCMFLYGLGVVIEYLHKINNSLNDILKDQRKVSNEDDHNIRNSEN